MDALSPEEIERYKRHILLPEIGGMGQQRLKATKVLVIGAGGLGAPVLYYLAAAGVGTLGIIDDDIVSLSNLQRQVIHDTGTIGEQKTESARRSISRLNPHVRTLHFEERFSTLWAHDHLSAFDLVIDGSDNFDTRYAVSDACFFEGKPLVTAALGQFDGSLTTIRAHEAGPDGRPNPTYRCLFPSPPPPGAIPTCAEAGVLGALAGVMGSLMAMEVVREIVGFGEARRVNPSGPSGSSSRGPSVSIAFRSAPAQKAASPAPATTSTRAPSSATNSRNASWSAAAVRSRSHDATTLPRRHTSATAATSISYR